MGDPNRNCRVADLSQAAAEAAEWSKWAASRNKGDALAAAAASMWQTQRMRFWARHALRNVEQQVQSKAVCPPLPVGWLAHIAHPRLPGRTDLIAVMHT